MVLLDILRRVPDLTLVVAHFNHGVRPDAGQDEKLVHHYAMSHNIEFVSKSVKLGANVSEGAARNARYAFLRQCRKRFNADFIVTAQHKDDLLETVVINLLRGTGWRGLAPFTNTNDVLRPLINYGKSAIIDYAKTNNVPWREDSTNQDQRYLRNYVRQSLIPRLQVAVPQFNIKLLRLVRKQQLLRRTIESQLDDMLAPGTAIDRHILIMLSPQLAYELLQQFLRRTMGTSLVRDLAEATLLFAKTAKPGKTMSLDASWRARATPKQLIVELRPTVLS